MRSYLPLCTLVLGASLFAQKSIIVPPGTAKTEGNALSAVPFAHDRIRAAQYIGASMIRNLIPYGSQITEIAYRRDGRALNSSLLRHTTTPSWSVRMANYSLDASSPSSAYLRPGTTINTLRVVMQRQFSFPDLPGGIGPMEFRLKFKLDRPFTYLGLGLVIEHYAYSSSNRIFSYYVDAVRKTPDAGSFVTYGKSCPAGELRASAIPSNPGGSKPLSMLLFGAKPSVPGFAIIGASKDHWGFVRLPIDLGVIGLKGCSLLAGIDLMVPIQTFTTGSANLSFKIPRDQRLLGTKLFGQWMVVDDRVSKQFPLAFSDGVDITLGKTLGASTGIDATMLYGTSFAARQSYGFPDRGLMLVTRLTW